MSEQQTKEEAQMQEEEAQMQAAKKMLVHILPHTLLLVLLMLVSIMKLRNMSWYWYHHQASIVCPPSLHPRMVQWPVKCCEQHIGAVGNVP